MSDIEQRLTRQETGMAAIAKALQKAAVEKQRLDEEKAKQETIDVLIKIQGAVFEKATAYTNVVILAGYAGILTIWGSLKSEFPVKANIAIALSAGVSLLLFVSWEVYKMIVSSHRMVAVAQLINKTMEPNEFSAALKRIQLENDKASVRLIIPWYIFLILTIVPAVVSVGLLFYNFVAGLLGWPFWPR